MKYALALKMGFRLQYIKEDLERAIDTVDSMERELTEVERDKVGNRLRKAYREILKATTDYTPVMQRNW